MDVMTDSIPHSTAPAWYRWVVLVFISLAMFGNYYIYDSISPLADLLSRQLGFSDSNIGLLNAIYSFPNILMVLISGIIIDRLGARKSSLIFSALCMIGAVVTAIQGNLITMAAGRLIFGLGAESLIVAITTVIARWFKGRQLSFAFGLNLSVARIGSVAAFNSPTWAGSMYDSWQKPLWIAAIAGLISVVTVIVYGIMDQNAVKRYGLDDSTQTDKIEWASIFKFNASFWYITLLCLTFYSAIFPFQTFAVKFFMEHHGVNRELGGFLVSTLTLSAMVLTPLFGLMADYIGKRSLLMMLGSLCLIPVYLMMGYTRVSLYIPMAMMGIAFSLIPAILWPSVALIVEPHKLGTAYGLMTMIQNIGFFAFNLLIGMANDYSQGYTMGMWIFSCLGFFGLFWAFMLRRNQISSGNLSLEKGCRSNS